MSTLTCRKRRERKRERAMTEVLQQEKPLPSLLLPLAANQCTAMLAMGGLSRVSSSPQETGYGLPINRFHTVEAKLLIIQSENKLGGKDK